VTLAALDADLPKHVVSRAIAEALEEDLGQAGDVTTTATVPAETTVHGVLSARAGGTVAGLEVARAAFDALDPEIRFVALVRDGDCIAPSATLARVSGRARPLLSAERVALNFLCHMSGIASLTARYVEAVRGTKARIVDTRKTTPGLRAFEKYAVRCGGGHNHRAGLFDAILIKDNHIVAAGGITAAVRAARAQAGHMVRIEVEVTSLAELEEALMHQIDAVLLDNMTREELGEAVRIVNGRVVTEASGGVTLENVRGIAETGVDLISVGALTHSAPILDIGLDFHLGKSAP
jgi:nicotinate-nucleotide pyrophosphorylase (carboxylating)